MIAIILLILSLCLLGAFAYLNNQPMNQYLTIITGLILCTNFIQAQDNKLSGTAIGSSPSVDYNTNTPSTTVNTPNYVFDGNFDTFYASFDRSNTWVGMDFGTACRITKIAYSPRISQPGRTLLAIFEGANNADFSDAIPLFIIPTAATEGVMTYTDINCTRGFRYVRYISPNDARCNIAELAFYGYQAQGDDSVLPQLTAIPTISIHTENCVDVTSKEEYLIGTATLVYNNGSAIWQDSLQIRGRGNASWGFPKKPYRIKLNNKANLAGLPANDKNWTLINNFGDKTLMRNLLANDISRRLNMPYTPAGIPVDLVLNGEYKGCYQLCDQIEVGKNRVDIDKMAITDVDGENLKGGYLVEIDAYANEGTSWFNSSKGNPVTIKYPKNDEIVWQQRNYIETYFNEMENILYSVNYKDLNIGYRSRLDLDTFLKHFIVGELAGNTDTYWSVYMYKYRLDDHFYTGPIWDFDLAFDNDSRTYPINNLGDYIYATNGSCAGNMRGFVNRILSDTKALDRLSDIWSIARHKNYLSADSLIKLIDRYAEEMDASQNLNFIRWPILNTYVHQNPRVYGTYEGELNNVKDYLRNRFTWLDNKIGLKEVTEIDEEPTSQQECIVFTEKNIIIVKNASEKRIIIYSVDGKILYSNESVDAETINVPTPNNGLYIINIDGISQKIFVK